MSRIIKLRQGSTEWLKWRQEGIGSSDAAAIMGMSPWKSIYQLLDEKAREEYRIVKQNPAMKRGTNLEPMARNLYTRQTYLIMEPSTMEHEELGFRKASIDGHAKIHKIDLEIKVPNKLDHSVALNGEVPEKYIAQCQHILSITGSKELHYFSFCPNFPGKKTALVVMKPDEIYQKEMIQLQVNFWNEVGELKKRRLIDPNIMPEIPKVGEDKEKLGVRKVIRKVSNF